MKLIVISKLDSNAIKKATQISESICASLILLSDAVYILSNTLIENKFKSIYVLKEDYEKRLVKNRSSFKLLEYSDLIDVLMNDESSIINL